MDLGLGADVDAARRLVEDPELRIVGEPLAEHNLLLIAAGQPACDLVDPTRLDAETRNAPLHRTRPCPPPPTPPARPPPLRRAVNKPSARQRPKRRERKIVQDAHWPH